MSDNKDGIYEISPFALEILEEKIERLNRRAKKLGVEKVRLEEVGRETREGTKILPFQQKSVKYEYEVILMKVHGPTPKLEGWTLVAKVEILGEERLIKCVPGEECPEEYRTRGLDCDHCKSSRRRTNVFVLRHEDGRHVQVGRQCISDFLGGVSPEHLLAVAALNLSLSEEMGEAEEGLGGWGGGWCEHFAEPHEFLTAVSICIRRLGWLSRSAAAFEGSATADDAWHLLNPPTDDKGRQGWEKWVEKNDLHYQERDNELAKEALEWAKSQPVEGVGDYLYNLGVSARAGFVKASSMGILASAVQAYLREKDREEEIKRREREDANKVRGHVGTEGKREVFEKLTVVYVNWYESQYGVRTLIKMEDAIGNIVTWWASKSIDDIDRGDVLTVKATVKKHDNYKGTKQTLVNRLVIEERHEEVAA